MSVSFHLHDAVNEGSYEKLREFLGGVLCENVNDRNSEGYTPFHLAAKNGNQEILQILWLCGAYMEIRANDGKQALHIAAENNNIKSALFLLNKNVKQEKDKNGDTPFDLAERNGYTEMTDILKKYPMRKRCRVIGDLQDFKKMEIGEYLSFEEGQNKYSNNFMEGRHISFDRYSRNNAIFESLYNPDKMCIRCTVEVVDTPADKASEVIEGWRFLETLDHPNIVCISTDWNSTIKDLDQVRSWLVQEKYGDVYMREYSGGENMHMLFYCGVKRINYFAKDNRYRKIAIQLLDAIVVLHEAGCAHRNIHPGNIILDVGIGEKGDRPMLLNSYKIGRVPLLGRGCTPIEYSSPESLTNDSYDLSCDMWSLGVTLYYFMLGKIPWESKIPLYDTMNDVKAYQEEMLGQEFKKVTIRYLTEKMMYDVDRIDSVMGSIIRKLLVYDPTERIGAKEARDFLEVNL